MASNASKVSFLRAISRRGYAAVVNPKSLGQSALIETKTLDNKIFVASSDSHLPISRVSVVFQAGARYETYDNLGASHMMRIACGQTTKQSTAFAIVRNLQQMGISLSVSSDREIFAYTIESTADNLECGLTFLQNSIYPSFKPWEISDAIPRVKYQASVVPPQIRAVELLHKAAYHSGLGNSIFIPKFKIGELSSETLLHYVANTCTANRCAVVAIGVDHNTLVGFAQSLEFENTEGKENVAASIYHGGDARKDTPGNITHVAIAGEGGAFSNPKEALAYSVLQHAMGTRPTVKYSNVNGVFGKVLRSVASDADCLLTTLNASYSDSGLFGFVMSTHTDNVSKIVPALVASLKTGSVSAEDFNRGKNLLKTAILDTWDTDIGILDEMTSQAIFTKKVQNVDSLVSAIDAVSHQDVEKAAKKTASSKLSIGAVGNLANVPYSTTL